MLADRLAIPVVVLAPAKVNLFLEVLKKRPDGYHELVTLMAAISLFDTLELTEETTNTIRLTCSRPSLPTGPENLVYRAAALLRQETGVTRGVHMHLDKQIPVAAGLAGGSSDAAAALRGLNELWHLSLSPEALSALAARLGSDIPFFLGRSAAWCRGRGEVVAPTGLVEPLHLVLANPGVELSTATVFRTVIVPEKPRSPEEMEKALASGSAAEIGRALFNRLQEPAVKLCPAVTETLRMLANQHPAGQQMSGSGSTCFALCRDREAAVSMADEVSNQLPRARVFVVKTL